MSRAETAVAAAALFAALGDPTRLALIDRLGASDGLSIVALSSGIDLTRQAITKHLAVLERAGLVESRRQGRESRFLLRADALADAQSYLSAVAAHWDDALARLKAHVEQGR